MVGLTDDDVIVRSLGEDVVYTNEHPSSSCCTLFSGRASRRLGLGTVSGVTYPRRFQTRPVIYIAPSSREADPEARTLLTMVLIMMHDHTPKHGLQGARMGTGKRRDIVETPLTDGVCELRRWDPNTEH